MGTLLSEKRELIMSQVPYRIRRTSHKHGVEVPDSLKYVAGMDITSKSDFWSSTTTKEIKHVGSAFDTLETGKVDLLGKKELVATKYSTQKLIFTVQAFIG